MSRFLSCLKRRQQAKGGGGSAQNVTSEVEEARWSLVDEEESDTGQGRNPHKRHQWMQVWVNIDMDDVFWRAKKL